MPLDCEESILLAECECKIKGNEAMQAAKLEL